MLSASGYAICVTIQGMIIRAGPRLAPSQWETSLQCNDVSHWLGSNLEPALIMPDYGRKHNMPNTRHLVVNEQLYDERNFPYLLRLLLQYRFHMCMPVLTISKLRYWLRYTICVVLAKLCPYWFAKNNWNNYGEVGSLVFNDALRHHLWCRLNFLWIWYFESHDISQWTQYS